VNISQLPSGLCLPSRQTAGLLTGPEDIGAPADHSAYAVCSDRPLEGLRRVDATSHPSHQPSWAAVLTQASRPNWLVCTSVELVVSHSAYRFSVNNVLYVVGVCMYSTYVVGTCISAAPPPFLVRPHVAVSFDALVVYPIMNCCNCYILIGHSYQQWFSW